MKNIIMLITALTLIAGCLSAQNTAEPTKKKLPPPPPKVVVTKFAPPVIVKDNDKGNAIRVLVENGDSIVSVTNDKGNQKIKMKDWKAKQSYYENKYGKLPPPPPAKPLPPPPLPPRPPKPQAA